MNKKGFTLAEILVSVMIVAMLAAMAVPMYDKAIEKARIAEARTVLKNMMDSKQRMLDNLEQETFSGGLFGIRNLDLGMACQSGGGDALWCQTKNFRYTLLPSGTSPVNGVALANAVCAARCGGDNKNVSFLYLGNLTDNLNNADTIAKFYCNESSVSGGEGCEDYGLTSTGNSAWCNCN